MQELDFHPSRSKPPTEAQLDALAVQEQQSAPRDTHTCPFCEDKPQEIARLGEPGNPKDMANLLVDHIAEHVRSLLFLSLPNLEDKASEKGGASDSLETSSRRRLRNTGSTPQPPSGFEFVEDISLTFRDDGVSAGSPSFKPVSTAFQVDREYEIEYMKDSGVHATEDKTQSFFATVPSTEPKFSWDFVPRKEIPINAVDLAFEHWHHHAAASESDVEMEEVHMSQGEDDTEEDAIIDTPHSRHYAPGFENRTNWKALSRAARTGNEAKVKRLIGRGMADINSKCYGSLSALHWAARNGHMAVLRLMLDTDEVDVDLKDGAKRRTPLTWAAKGGHETVVRLLIDTRKVNVNSRDWAGQTPLCWAATNGYEAIVRLLIECDDVEVDRARKDGSTALSLAASIGHESIVRMLIGAGANIESADQYGDTALLLAVYNGNEKVVELLLNAGANTESKDKEGSSALLLAAANGDEAIVRLLIQAGADVNATDVHGLTALALAAEGGNEDVIELLESVSAKAEDTHPSKYHLRSPR